MIDDEPPEPAESETPAADSSAAVDGPEAESPPTEPDENAAAVATNDPTRRRRRKIWITGWAFVLAGVLILASIVWVAFTGLDAERSLRRVPGEVDQLRTELLAGDFAAARLTAARLGRDAGHAHDRTSGPAWWAAAGVPGIGDPMTSVRGIARAADELAGQVLPPAIDALQTLTSPAAIRSPGDINTGTVQTVATQLTALLARAQGIRGDVSRLPKSTWIGQVDSARTKLNTALDTLVQTLTEIKTGLGLAPALLGADGPRRYFVGFLNSSELRGLGGLPGAFAILEADHGKVTFTHFGSDNELLKIDSGVTPAADYASRYRDFRPTAQYLNSDVSPNFPDAAKIWAGIWQRKSGQHIDGAIAVDPTALSYLLGATGGTTLADGTVVNAGNIVTLTQSTAYQRFGDDQAARKQFLLDVASAADKKIFSSTGNSVALLRAASRAVDERRLLVWSDVPAEQSQLAPYSISGEVPVTTQPFGLSSINNFSANKLDYYLHETVTWSRTGCGAQRTVTVTIRLTNDAPRGLSQYESGQAPSSPTSGEYDILLDWFGTTGGHATSVTWNGKPIATNVSTERGHPVYRQQLHLPRTATQTLVLTLQEPAGTAAPEIVAQPLRHPVGLTVQDGTC